MNVIIVHGWGYSPEGHWQQWLLKELKNRKIEATLPTLPDYDHPIQNKWVEALAEEHIDENTVLVGHSLGNHTILRLLEKGTKIKAAILVSGFAEYNGLEPIQNFFKTPFDWKTIKKNAQTFIVINSDNDPYFSFENGEKLAKNLGVPLLTEHNAGHISISAGFGPYPRILELVLKNLI